MLRMTLSMVHGCWPAMAERTKDTGDFAFGSQLSSAQLSLGSWLVGVGNSITGRSKLAGRSILSKIEVGGFRMSSDLSSIS